MSVIIHDKAAATPVPFQPLPWLANPHLQTVLGTLWTGTIPPLAGRDSLLVLADGDRLLISDSTPASWGAGDWVAILVHGLGGSSQSGSVRRLATGLLAEGLRVVRVNLRGAGPTWKLARQLYHGGSSDDVRAVADEMARRAPGSPFVLIGLSLGGNIALKLAGEASVQPLANLAGVAALSAPIDLLRCCNLMSEAGNRLYERYYLRKLVLTAERHQQHFPDLPQIAFPRYLTLRQFDELHTAPRWGFADALDYYQRSAALPWVPRIKVPAFLMTAHDDPFVASAPYHDLPPRRGQQIHVLDHGGHLGFLGHDGAGGVRWAERRLVEWTVGLRDACSAPPEHWRGNPRPTW